MTLPAPISPQLSPTSNEPDKFNLPEIEANHSWQHCRADKLTQAIFENWTQIPGKINFPLTNQTMPVNCNRSERIEKCLISINGRIVFHLRCQNWLPVKVGHGNADGRTTPRPEKSTELLTNYPSSQGARSQKIKLRRGNNFTADCDETFS